jgi:hypothetical protein
VQGQECSPSSRSRSSGAETRRVASRAPGTSSSPAVHCVTDFLFFDGVQWTLTGLTQDRNLNPEEKISSQAVTYPCCGCTVVTIFSAPPPFCPLCMLENIQNYVGQSTGAIGKNSSIVVMPCLALIPLITRPCSLCPRPGGSRPSAQFANPW